MAYGARFLVSLSLFFVLYSGTFYNIQQMHFSWSQSLESRPKSGPEQYNKKHPSKLYVFVFRFLDTTKKKTPPTQ